jgi:PAS domain-containing protein
LKPTEPLPLHHSWPLTERERRFALGQILDWPPLAPGGFDLALFSREELAARGIGLWQCELAGNALTWSATVYDIFGLPHDARLHRDEAAALYAESSRAAMERLRAYAIKHRRGFTLDAEIRPASGPARWMRLTAAPVCEGNRVVRLQGVKQFI